jgi:hypothetical protein
MQPLLTILIPTVVGREAEVDRLIGSIDLQCSILGGYDEVEVIQLKDNKEITIGEKRERLYKMANGLFSWQIDDDDAIAPDAIQTILAVIKDNPSIPCITFRENCMMNGEYKSSNHSIKYDRWYDNFDGYDYVRCPFYKDVIRTDIAKSVPFEYIRYNEDEKFSMAIKPLLTDEAHIDKEIYFYIYEPKDTHEERYGYDPK